MSKTTSLKTLLREGVENRINLMKINTILEKIMTELTDKETKKLTEVCGEFSQMVNSLNTLPYTMFNMREWQVLLVATHLKLHEIKEEVTKIADKESKINFVPLIKALDEVLLN